VNCPNRMGHCKTQLLELNGSMVDAIQQPGPRLEDQDALDRT